MSTKTCAGCVVIVCLWGLASPSSLGVGQGERSLVRNDNVEVSAPISLVDYIKKFGYPVEAHEITTEDGYILTYHRIPHGKSSQVTGGTPVLVQHGIMADSAIWVSVADSLGFALADAGFDVWLGNARGTTYSRKHVKYDPDKDKKAFWDFSWHEMGYYDLPASIDYILNITGHEKLSYMGHSMGTTMYFVLGATRPEYMNKVTAMAAMAPVVYLWNVRSPVIRLINDLHTPLLVASEILGIYELFPYSKVTYYTEELVCGDQELQTFCRDLIFSFVGFDGPELNKTLLTTYFEFLPGGSSTKTFHHYSQIIKQGAEFKNFDYGLMGNLAKYGNLRPPTYNLNKVTSPVYIYYGNNDWLVSPEDALRTGAALPNLKRIVKVADDKWNHLDFQLGSDVKALVYDDLISTFLNLTSNSNMLN